MNRTILIGVGVIVVSIVAYWLLSPLWRNSVLNEDLPRVTTPMDANTKAEFEKQTMEMKDKAMTVSDAMPIVKSSIVRRAAMVAGAHDVAGTALLIKSGNETFLRFENLKTINGPDLRIYLASDLSANDFIDLGPIRATEGNVNYVIPAGTDLNTYRYAMIWCRAFGVLFSYAKL